MGDYHDLYLKTDVLLLTVFENFLIHAYNIMDLILVIILAILDKLLKLTGIELELISDIDMHLFIQKGMKGDIS